MGFGHDTPTSTSFIETALFIPKANCINISAICTKHLLPDKQKRNLLHICNHHHDPRFILWGVWTGYTPWHHVRGAEQKGSQGHICTLRTHLYTADIFIQCRHIYTLRTHLWTLGHMRWFRSKYNQYGTFIKKIEETEMYNWNGVQSKGLKIAQWGDRPWCLSRIHWRLVPRQNLSTFSTLLSNAWWQCWLLRWWQWRWWRESKLLCLKLLIW